MREYKPSDFTGEEKEEKKIGRREMLYAVGAGGLGASAAYLTYENRDRFLPDNENVVCIHEDVLENYDVFGDLEPTRPDDDGFHKFLYKEDEDQWYLQKTYITEHSSFEVREQQVSDQAIEEILENTGDTSDYSYNWGEEVLENCQNNLRLVEDI